MRIDTNCNCMTVIESLHTMEFYCSHSRQRNPRKKIGSLTYIDYRKMPEHSIVTCPIHNAAEKIHETLRLLYCHHVEIFSW